MVSLNMRQSPAAIGLAAACGLLAMVVAGCGRGPERIVVTGAVTYRGQPIPQGAIGFYPCEGTEGAPAIVAIADGKYRADSLGGVPVGNYRVVIQGVRKDPNRSKPQNVDDGQPPMDLMEQYLPAKYNAKTELKTTIESSRGSLTRDFALTD
jgi:hypothetical protein